MFTLLKEASAREPVEAMKHMEFYLLMDLLEVLTKPTMLLFSYSINCLERCTCWGHSNIFCSVLFPAVRPHSDPEYEDETMTVYQVPLVGE